MTTYKSLKIWLGSKRLVPSDVGGTWGTPRERYVRQPASVEWPTCPYNFDNQDEESGLSDQATPSVRAKFCQVNASSGVTEDGFELTRFVNCLMRRFCISLKVTIKSDNTERLQQEQQVREENRQNTWFAQSLFFYELSDHSTIFRKCTSDGGVVRLNVNPGDIFTPSAKVSSRTWGQPPPCTQALNVISFYTTATNYSLVLYLQNLLS